MSYSIVICLTGPLPHTNFFALNLSRDKGGISIEMRIAMTAITNKHLYQSESHSNCPRLG